VVAGELQARGCELGFEPVAPIVDRLRACSDASQLPYHLSHRHRLILVRTAVDDAEDVAHLAEYFQSVKEIEIQCGSCGLSFGSAEQVAERIRRRLPDVRIRVTSFAIPVVG
jgi:hypothetical protein